MAGVRSSKTVNGTEYKYTTLSGLVTRQEWNGSSIDFIYDDSNQPLAMKYNGTLYYYILNAQGDVVRIIDGSRNVVASYSYDPWGKIISSSGALTDVNPLRYRGYYYDTETGFYYLQSRYYDPELGRFINADSYASTDATGLLSANMFAYCENDPVNMVDYAGCSPFSLILSLFDYAAMHKMVQIKCAMDYGWTMEQYISGPLGKGRLDLYDSVKNEYYEVKSIRASQLPSTRSQMQKYDRGTVRSSGLVPDRGTNTACKGSFVYGIYDVHYELKEPGLIVYDKQVNSERALALATIGICCAVCVVAPEVAVPLITAFGFAIG